MNPYKFGATAMQTVITKLSLPLIGFILLGASGCASYITYSEPACIQVASTNDCLYIFVTNTERKNSSEWEKPPSGGGYRPQDTLVKLYEDGRYEIVPPKSSSSSRDFMFFANGQLYGVWGNYSGDIILEWYIFTDDEFVLTEDEARLTNEIFHMELSDLTADFLRQYIKKYNRDRIALGEELSPVYYHWKGHDIAVEFLPYELEDGVFTVSITAPTLLDEPIVLTFEIDLRHRQGMHPILIG